MARGISVLCVSPGCLQGEPLDAAGGEQPLALYSRPLGVNCAAKFSRHQLAAFTWKANNFDSVWQVGMAGPGGHPAPGASCHALSLKSN